MLGHVEPHTDLLYRHTQPALIYADIGFEHTT
jgi:hypothetical protein